MTRQLPRVMSELIVLGLDDLRKVEQSKLYRVNMGDWHRPIGDKCVVCLAGAVMAETLGTPIDSYEEPWDRDDGNVDQLLALDSLRIGDVCTAARELELPLDTPAAAGEFDRDIANYHDDKEAFHKQMRQLADDLREAGF